MGSFFSKTIVDTRKMGDEKVSKSTKLSNISFKKGHLQLGSKVKKKIKLAYPFGPQPKCRTQYSCRYSDPAPSQSCMGKERSSKAVCRTERDIQFWRRRSLERRERPRLYTRQVRRDSYWGKPGVSHIASGVRFPKHSWHLKPSHRQCHTR